MEKINNIYSNLIFDKSDDPILIIKNGKFIDCNAATVKMLRYKTKKELLDTHPSELSPEFQPDGKPSFEKADKMMRIAFKKGTHRFEWDHKKADGEVFPVEVLLTDISINADEKILYTVWRDITNRKKAERMHNALLSISECTYTASDMKALYKKIHNIISELITVKNIYIALYNEKSKLLSFPYFVDEIDPPQPPKKLGKGLTEYVLRTGEATLIDEKKDLELRAKGEVDLVGSPTKIWLGVPLKISTK
ncbi:MAG: PAS domain S-box protein [Bacteroidetes bacterium]|nr:PAS domain S-box protein [Bacteroidota bacterium]